MGFKLTIEQGKGRGQAFDFDAEEITIGRTDENDVVLYDGGVSRQHAKISFDGQHWLLSDLDSANGTTLNGAKVASEVLESGDHVGIGGAVFRFEVSAGGAATRIVSVEQAEKEAAAKRAGKVAKSAPEAPRPMGADPRLVRLVGLGVLAVLALVVLLVVYKAKKANGLKQCPSPLSIAGVGDFVFGSGVDADCQVAASGLRFGFVGAPKTRYLLHYAAFYVTGQELAIVLNGQQVATAPPAPGRRSDRQTLALPDNLIRSGDNELVFRDLNGADDSWGVERVELESIPLLAASLEKAEEARRIGEKLYHDRNVAAPNLYNAWTELRDARKYYEGLAQKPTDYQTTLDLIGRIEKELDKLCKKELFAAQQDTMYNKYAQANEAYQFILAAFPGDAHPCRQKAQSRLYMEQAQAAQQ